MEEAALARAPLSWKIPSNVICAMEADIFSASSAVEYTCSGYVLGACSPRISSTARGAGSDKSGEDVKLGDGANGGVVELDLGCLEIGREKFSKTRESLLALDNGKVGLTDVRGSGDAPGVAGSFDNGPSAVELDT